MTQASLLGSGGVNKGKETLKPRLQITVPHFDNSELIKGYSQTLIGRCMNPQKQDVKFLITTFPRIWKMENRVTGADLGRGRFQFDFDEEEDIKTVLRMGPYHFDHWMVSLVRWQPVFDPYYPSAITFWVRLVELPLQCWAEPTFREIGKALGTVEDVDIDGGRVQVCVNGFKPLAFDGSITFDGHEVPVFLTYERLVGFCKECYSLCHDKDYCPALVSKREERVHVQRREEIPDTRFLSYKGAVQASTGDIGDMRRGQFNERKVDYKGKGKAQDTREGGGLRQNDLRGRQRNDGGGGSNQRMLSYAPPKELRKRFNESMRGDLKIVEAKEQGPAVFTKDPTGGISAEAGTSLPTSPYHSAKKVRTKLIFEEEGGNTMGNAIVGKSIVEDLVAGNGMAQDGVLLPPHIPENEAEDMISSNDDLLGEDENGEQVEMDAEDGESNQVVGPPNEGDMMDVRQEVEEFQHANRDGVSRGKQFDRNQGVKKKPFRTNVTVGGGAMRHLAHVSKTPRKKLVGKGSLGNKMGDKNGKEDDDPAAGKGKGKNHEG